MGFIKHFADSGEGEVWPPPHLLKKEDNKMELGKVEYAERRALNLFDKWNDVTGFVPKHSSYYYEIQSVVTDAVHCGIQGALKNYKLLEGEE